MGVVGRRQFLVAAGALLAAPLSANAQKPGKVYRIGFLRPAQPPAPWMDAFRKGLRRLGYVEGRDLVIESRWAGGKAERLAALADELVRLNLEVIVASGTVAILAAKDATRVIPIVMAAVGAPVETGLVASFARPGGNITGVSNAIADVGAKRLELLKEVVPTISSVAVLWNGANPYTVTVVEQTKGAARSLGIQLQFLEVRAATEFDRAFTAATHGRPDGLFVVEDPLTISHRRPIADFAAKQRLPAVYGSGGFVKVGGLLSYGASFPALYGRAAVFVDKILKGAEPADLPVERPTRFEFLINLKTAKALDLTIPPSILLRATQVIQ